VHTICGEDSVDYCFTDPPYSNDINFLDLSVLWAAWLGCEISPESKRSELGGDQATRSFEEEFDASIESIARCLKTDRWFTLVYKHTDLSLWQNIVAACERHGLRYVNSVWQDLKIRSTRQIENPDINPKGDMYLNFRKMSRRSFEIAYPTALVLDLPTLPNYIEKEIERLIVCYLGADIKLIASRLIQELLDTRATAHEHDRNPETLTKDIATVIRSPRFASKTSQRGETYWVLSDQASPDPSLPLFDRARYCLFDFLCKSGEASEGDASRYLLTRCTDATGNLDQKVDIASLARQMAVKVGPHRWRFDEERVRNYQQLRLFFDKSRADELRNSLRKRRAGGPLEPSFAGLALLIERLNEANVPNSHFETQLRHLLLILGAVLQKLSAEFSDQIVCVIAAGAWSQHGIDLRNLPYEEILLEIIIEPGEQRVRFSKEIAERVFAGVSDEFLVQFRLITASEWEHAKSVSAAEALGIPLLAHS